MFFAKLAAVLSFAIATATAVPLSTPGPDWEDEKSLPDGDYSGIVQRDGSIIWSPLDRRSETASVHIRPKHQPATPVLEKRKTSECWNDRLDTAGVDQAAQALREWAGTGSDLSAQDTTNIMGFQRKGVVVYYCINQPHRQGNLDVGDVDFALYWMDQDCGSYQAGYFKWPETPFEIVGKSRPGTPICLG
ncbi:hypothetical protein Q7P37_008752 [Cladosporium fusiforme]